MLGVGKFLVPDTLGAAQTGMDTRCGDVGARRGKERRSRKMGPNFNATQRSELGMLNIQTSTSHPVRLLPQPPDTPFEPGITSPQYRWEEENDCDCGCRCGCRYTVDLTTEGGGGLGRDGADGGRLCDGGGGADGLGLGDALEGVRLHEAVRGLVELGDNNRVEKDRLVVEPRDAGVDVDAGLDVEAHGGDGDKALGGVVAAGLVHDLAVNGPGHVAGARVVQPRVPLELNLNEAAGAVRVGERVARDDVGGDVRGELRGVGGEGRAVGAEARAHLADADGVADVGVLEGVVGGLGAPVGVVREGDAGPVVLLPVAGSLGPPAGEEELVRQSELVGMYLALEQWALYCGEVSSHAAAELR
eukprot:CAMPEP_0197451418 /NCGR_PEP_ID=MMETSP1175-20131217/28775_1 /TAXON_ID=1003142 /ORGANISM="Triceratium dubium, Strain CCMP147" /LENGTH=359 /DNA_ID=CAMNT_0042984125 /DNA_START=29 /DNA_END=1109 /DNA_ORIENTATION=-